jgi:hypothetical protein
MRTLIHTALIAGLTCMPVMPLAAATQTADAKLARITAGRVAGKMVNCINLGISSNDSEKLPGVGIAYRQGTSWYVSRFEGGCPQLRDDTIVITKLHSSQLCRGDIADLTMAGANIPVGSCVFGAFTPYTKQ